MQRILVLIILISLISTANGIRQEIYSTAIPSDEGIHLYFSEILEDAEKSLGKILDEDPASINISIAIHQRIILTEDEARFYTARGVETSVPYVLGPYEMLSDGLKRFAVNQQSFLRSMELLQADREDPLAYINASMAFMNMKLAVREMNDSMGGIERIELWNGSQVLKFDVSGIRAKLADLGDLMEYYSTLMGEFERGGIVVAVSDTNPILYQNVTIMVFARNVTDITLYIDENGIPVHNGSIIWNFQTVGRHEVYAIGTGENGSVKSNTVHVDVRKIPTYILLSANGSAYINEIVGVEGYLVDYYSNAVNGNVAIKAGEELMNLKSVDGRFFFNVTRSSEGYLNITADYPGDEIHASSHAELSIFFSRFPVSISLTADRTEISVNETVNFSGTVMGPDYSIPLSIYVNSEEIDVITAESVFQFSLNFSNPGSYSVKVRFPGDSTYRPAEAGINIAVKAPAGNFQETGRNVVERVEESGVATYLPALAGFLAVVIPAISAYVYIKRSKRQVFDHQIRAEPEKAESEREVKRRLRIPETTGGAYRMLFNRLAERYGFKRGTTPREALKALEREPFADKFRVVTGLHEKEIYGGIRLEEEEKKMFFRMVNEIMRMVT